LLDAFRHAGCPACRLAAAAVDHFLDDLIYEHVNEIELRDTLRAAGGFCNEHSWQLKHMRAAFGTSIIYRDVLNNIARRLRARQAGSTGAASAGAPGRQQVDTLWRGAPRGRRLAGPPGRAGPRQQRGRRDSGRSAHGLPRLPGAP
jgi:hypothetical protein